jgi:hypothetical protein
VRSGPGEARTILLFHTISGNSSGPLNSLVWYVPSLRYTHGLVWRMHCGAEVTESSTNKQHHLSRVCIVRCIPVIHTRSTHRQMAMGSTVLKESPDCAPDQSLGSTQQQDIATTGPSRVYALAHHPPGLDPPGRQQGSTNWRSPPAAPGIDPLRSGPLCDPRRPRTPHDRTLHAGTPRSLGINIDSILEPMGTCVEWLWFRYRQRPVHMAWDREAYQLTPWR